MVTLLMPGWPVEAFFIGLLVPAAQEEQKPDPWEESGLLQDIDFGPQNRVCELDCRQNPELVNLAA